jgi:hypothetical protein
MASNNVLPALRELRDRGLIDDAEMLRLAYRFCGETVDVEEMLARGRAAAPTASASAGIEQKAQPVNVDPISGEESTQSTGETM